MIFAPLSAASSQSLVSFCRFAWTAPRSDEHWTAATLTVAGRVVGGVGASAACVIETSAQHTAAAKNATRV
jgi:hypothetical protein